MLCPGDDKVPGQGPEIFDDPQLAGAHGGLGAGNVNTNHCSS